MKELIAKPHDKSPQEEVLKGGIEKGSTNLGRVRGRLEKTCQPGGNFH